MTVHKPIYGAIICATALAITPAFAMGGFHIGGGFAGAAGKIGSKAGSAVHGLSAFHATSDISGKGSEAVSAGTPKLADTPDAADVAPKALHEKAPTTGTTADGISEKDGGIRAGEYASVKGTVHKVADDSSSTANKVPGVAKETTKRASSHASSVRHKAVGQPGSIDGSTARASGDAIRRVHDRK
jgi:hypothetical protein